MPNTVSDDAAPSSSPADSYVGVGALSPNLKPLWAYDNGPGAVFQSSGDPAVDHHAQALRYLIGLDNPAYADDQMRATMAAMQAGQFPDAPSGGQLIKVLNPPQPRVTQTGSWSEPYFSADEGQDGDALKGALALRDRWRSKQGGVYAVDPKVMGMEHGIDIGQQIQDSIDQGGYMRGVLDQALKSGKAVPFDSGNWGHSDFGVKRFDDHPYTPDGATVGRWGGFVQGSLSAQPDGTWIVNAGLWPQKTGPYDFQHDAAGNAVQKIVGNLGIDFGRFANGAGAPFLINFNRMYNFRASGEYNNTISGR